MNSKEFLKILGERIRTIRKVRKISQERLAELSGLHPTYISDIERGKVNASIYIIYMITHALDIPFSELISFLPDKVDKKIEAQIAEMLSSLRGLGKKKQTMFLSVAKSLIYSIKSI